MIANKLNEPVPFNDFVFKSCYYHQLIAGLSVLGIEKDGLLLNSFYFMHDDFIAEEKVLFPEKTLFDILGLKIEKDNMNQKKLIRNIDCGNPVIVGVDSYYLQSRDETYLKSHDLHFILVYGYDTAKDTVYTVDHNYRNGMYSLKELSMSNVLYANHMQHKGVNKSRYTCRILKRKKKNDNQDSTNFWNFISKSQLEKSRKSSERNLAELKELFERDIAMLKTKSLKIERYGKSLKGFYFAMSKTTQFQSGEKSAVVNGIIGAYNAIVSLFWKMHVKDKYDHDENMTSKIVRKIDELDNLENQLYRYLYEVAK